jgi:hypothetical protein
MALRASLEGGLWRRIAIVQTVGLSKKMDENALRNLALSTLRGICEDPKSPKNAKAVAARCLLETLGDIGKLQSQKPKENKMLHEMNRDELDAEFLRLASKAKRATSAKDGEIRHRIEAKRKTPARSKAKREKRGPTLGRHTKAEDDERYPF